MKKMKRLILIPLLMAAFFTLTMCTAPEPIDLSGDWTYRLDPEDKGRAEAWFNESFDQHLTFPGSLNTNGIGDEVTAETAWTGSMWNRDWYEKDEYDKYRDPENTKVVFWLTPDKYYVGKAWYQKKIIITEKMAGKRLFLQLERCHWTSELWVDSHHVGNFNSLAIPHRYELQELEPGDHMLTFCIDNAIRDIEPGVDAHSISDNTQSNWNGIIGTISMEVRPQALISSVRIEPLFESRQIRVEALVDASTDMAAELQLRVAKTTPKRHALPASQHNLQLKAGHNSVVLIYDMVEDFELWDEFQVNLYELTAELETRDGKDRCTEPFGLRKLATEGSRILINDRPAFFRGTLECCIFPETGFPPTTVEPWRRIMKIVKSHGLNHLRFHSWCPPEAAFQAADEEGVYFYVECGSWASCLGEKTPLDEFLMEESRRIVREYGNHPSFCLMSYGNEPWGAGRDEFLGNFVKYWKNRDHRFLYTTGAGWPALECNDWHCLPAPRIQGWGQGINSIINSQTPNSEYDWEARISKTTPTISHEIGQWCVYPDLKERARYTGVMKAKNFDIFEDRLKANGLEHYAEDFLMASGKLQTLCYKADIEAALRTKGFSGFQLLDLHDFPGQGSALVGVLNPFWESKGYVTPEEYSEFCNEIVPLARMPKFTYRSGEHLIADIEVAQYSASAINDPVSWKLVGQSGKTACSGSFEARTIPTGDLASIGTIDTIVEVVQPTQFQLIVSVGKYHNHWNLWFYPEVTRANDDILVASTLSNKAVRTLQEGGKVLLTPTKGKIRNTGADSLVVAFSSIFWNTLWTNGQPPHTLGILCDPSHPALRLFPTASHSDYQWWDAMTHCDAIPLRKISSAQPIVRIIDDWFKARSLGLVVEMKVGEGSLVICGADLLTDAENRLEARQLLQSLLQYMDSDEFKPTGKVGIEEVRSLF